MELFKIMFLVQFFFPVKVKAIISFFRNLVGGKRKRSVDWLG